jgi:NADPH-dependent 2,4-dienoyl-CoA reductase/sulfur reductase-like enzyme
LKAPTEGNKITAEVKDCNQEAESFPEPNRIDPGWKQPKVVIIGAGMAGLAAAQRLTKCGITDLVVLEALPRWNYVH